MNLRNKIAIITCAATLAFVGTGYAAWAFTAQVTDNAPVQGKVTAAIEAKGLQVQDGAGNEVNALYLICDAPSGKDGLIAGNGIYWSTENSNDFSKKITTLTLVGSVNEDDNDIADIHTYTGHFASTATAAVDGTYVDIPETVALNADVTSTAPDADVSCVWTLPVPAYDVNHIPGCVADVEALQQEVNNLSLSFAFQFNVKSVA